VGPWSNVITGGTYIYVIIENNYKISIFEEKNIFGLFYIKAKHGLHCFMDSKCFRGHLKNQPGALCYSLSCLCVPLGEKVAEIASCSGALKFDNPKPWWPYLMTDEESGII